MGPPDAQRRPAGGRDGEQDDRLRHRHPQGTSRHAWSMLRTGVLQIDALAGLGADAIVNGDPLLDTLGKVMPPALMGESSYGRDYRVGSTLKYLTDSRPRSALAVNHHDRKAASEDFVEKVSGSNGLAGSADTVVVLARKRNEPDGLLSVTGRDVAEGEYAVRFDGASGLWSLDGRDLSAAAARVAQRRMSDGLDERARAVVDYVNEHPEGVRFAEVKRDLGEAEARYLSRLAEGDRIARRARGLYAPLSVVSEVSVSTTQPHTTDTESESGQGKPDTTDTTDTPLGPVPEEMF